MAQLIEVPGQGSFEFPDDFSEEQITQAFISNGIYKPQPTKRKTSIGEDVLIGLEGAKNSFLDTASLVGGGLAGLMGREEDRDRVFQTILDRKAQAEQEASQVEQGFGGKVISGVTGIVPMLAGGAAIAGVKGMAAAPSIINALSESGRDIQEGAGTGETVALAPVKGVVDYVTNMLPAGKGLVGGAAWGAGGGIAGQAATDVAGQAVLGDSDAKKNYEFSLEKNVLLPAAVGGVVGGTVGKLTGEQDKTVKAAEKTPVEPKQASAYVQNTINDLDTQFKSRERRIKELTSISDKIQQSLAKKEQQLSSLSRLENPDSKTLGIIEALKKQVTESTTKLDSINDNIKQIRPEMEALNSRIQNLGGEGFKPDAPLPKEDPFVAKAKAEEDQMAKLEQRVVEPELPPETAAKVDGLDLEIQNLERFLGTKQGTKAVRADVEEQLNSLRAERDALARPPEIPETGTPFAETAGQPTQREPFRAGRDRYQVGDKFHAKEAEFVTYSPEVLKNMWDNKVDKLLTIQDPELRAMIMEEKAAIENAYGIVTKGEKVDKTVGKAPTMEGPVIRTVDDAGQPRPLNDLLTDAIANTKSPWLKSMLERIQNNPNLTRLQSVINDMYLYRNKAEAAYSNAKASPIFKTFTNGLDLAHEMIHAAANDVLIRYEAKDGTLTLEQRAAAKYVNDAYDKLIGNKALANWDYAMSNVREFVAHLSDKDFANAVKVAMTPTKFQEFINKLVQMASKTFGFTPKEAKSFEDLMGTTNYLIDTAAGMATPADILKSVGLLRNDFTKSVEYATLDTKLRDGLAVLEEKLTNDRNGVVNVTAGSKIRTYLAGAAEVAQANQKSPLVRHTFTAIKRADELYEEGKRYIIEGTANEKRTKFGLRNLTDVEGGESYNIARRNASNRDLIEGRLVVLEGHQKRIAFDQVPGFKQLSKSGQELVLALGKAYKRGHDWSNSQLEKTGAKPMPYREGYVYHQRDGDHGVYSYVRDESGNRVLAGVHYAYTDAERRAFMRNVIEKNPDIEIDPSTDVFSVKAEKTRQAEATERELATMIEEASRVGGKIDPEVIDRLRQEAVNARFFGGHHLFQTSVEGYKGNRWYRSELENAKDLFDTPFHYADELGRFARNEVLRKATDPFLNNPEVYNEHKYLDTDPEIIMARDLVDRTLNPQYDSMVKDAIDYVASRIVDSANALTKENKLSRYPDKSVFDRVNGVLTTFFNYSKMMARPAFAASQAMSWTSQVPQYLSVTFGDSFGKASDSMLKGVARSMDFREGTEFDNFIMRARKHHTFKPTTVNDFTQLRIELANSGMNKALSTGASLLSGKRLSEMADTYSRYMAFSILYEKGKSMGLKGDELFNFVIDHTDNSMSLFQRDKKAPIITRTGVFGDMLAPVSNYIILQGNWTATAAKKLVQDKNIHPMMTIILANAIAGGTVALPLVAEYEVLRTIFNSMLPDDMQMPSFVRVMHEYIGAARDSVTDMAGPAAGRLTDAVLRHGSITGATQAIAELFGVGKGGGLDIGSGLRYQALGKNFFDENKSLWDSFSAWSAIVKDVNSIADVITGKDVTEANIRRAYDATRTSIISDYLNDTFFIPYFKNESGKEMQTVGKDSAALFERTENDKWANYLGTRTTRAANESTVRTLTKEKERKQQAEVGKAMQGLLDHVVRAEARQVPLGMRGMQPAAIKRLEVLSRKYPDMEPFLNTISQRLDQEMLKRQLPEIIRTIENSKPYELKEKLKIYQDITGNKVKVE